MEKLWEAESENTGDSILATPINDIQKIKHLQNNIKH